MRKVVANYIYNLIYNLVTLVAPLIVAPYLARTLGAEGTGVYSYVNSLTSLICTVVMLGIFTYGNRQIAYIRDNKEKVNQVFWQVMSTRLIITLVGTVVYFTIFISIGKYFIYFLLYYPYLLGYFLDCTWLFIGLEDMKWAVLKNTLIKVISIIGIFLFVKQANDALIYVFIQGASILIANLLAYTQLYHYVGKFKLDFSNFRKDIKESFYLFLPSVASAIYLQCDKLMIELLTGNIKDVSFYDYSEKIVAIPLSFITVLSTVIMPRLANEFYRNNKEKISDLLGKVSKFSLFMSIPLTVGMIAISSNLIPWYLGTEFTPSILVIQILSLTMVLDTLSGIAGRQFFTATNQIGKILVAQCLAIVVNILLNFILIPTLGFWGASLSTLISSFLSLIIQFTYFFKQVTIVGFFGSLIKYTLIALIMFASIYFITSQMSSTPMTTLIQISIGLVVYLGVCLIIKDEHLLRAVDILRRNFR